ncbi:DUF308 domain-containing protein [Streptomyces sp. NPDC097981]|uniref:HdeD family acid-resistance protein n=1 Tax=Streptomyces sp. NPDC097981 TaxID=3155428 RepID=UPI00331C9807
MTAPDAGPQLPGEPASGGAPARSTGDPVDKLSVLGASWGWALGSALVTLATGIIVLVWPDETLHVLAVVIGLYLLVAGGFRFVAAFSRREHGERFLNLLAAVAFVLAGILCLRNPLQTITWLGLIVGLVWLVSGLLTAFSAIADKGLPHRGAIFCAGALGVVAGIVVLCLPTESVVVLTRLLGLWLILLGVAELVIAFAIRSALHGHHDTGPRLG